MNTNAGMNWIGLLVLVYQGVNAMPEGTFKHVLTGMTLTAISIVAFATRGSGLSSKQSEEILDVTEDLESVLKKGRK